jgi:hypothetical protein
MLHALLAFMVSAAGHQQVFDQHLSIVRICSPLNCRISIQERQHLAHEVDLRRVIAAHARKLWHAAWTLCHDVHVLLGITGRAAR